MPWVGQVPALAEQGIQGFESGTWQGRMVPAAMPAAQVAQAANVKAD